MEIKKHQSIVNNLQLQELKEEKKKLNNNTSLTVNTSKNIDLEKKNLKKKIKKNEIKNKKK